VSAFSRPQLRRTLSAHCAGGCGGQALIPDRVFIDSRFEKSYNEIEDNAYLEINIWRTFQRKLTQASLRIAANRLFFLIGMEE